MRPQEYAVAERGKKRKKEKMKVECIIYIECMSTRKKLEKSKSHTRIIYHVMVLECL